ncbi:MotE family protein [Oceanobacillus luteolus]|uniref:MotE family protein n=1 Tax=Oceanobacillus luteolus TaxID=1274358 RepID=A0ABW4HRB9_9BACI
MTSKKQTEKKKMNPILWFLFAIVIPLIIVSIIIAVILSFSGFNIVDWVKKTGSNTPVISHLVTSQEEDQLAEELERLNQELQSRNEELDQLNTLNTNLEATIEELETELTKQEATISRYESENHVDGDSEEIESEVSLKNLAKTFEEMKPVRAADILSNMTQEEVILILKELSDDVRGGILEAMDAELAANIASEMLN